MANYSIAMYHTAGKGTRLAPIPGAENNNKPGVKLPALVKNINGGNMQLTMLESVIKQTGVYAASRPGRLSVFWGDQVFIPSASTRYESSYHADILAQMGPMPTQEEWEAKGYSNYGLIATGATGEGAQVEKVTFDQARELLSGLGDVTEVGPSLGSFSVSTALLGGLLQEFDAELKAKKVALDSDPHFWMPMTLPLAAYVDIMGTKDMSAEAATAHYARLQRVKVALPRHLKTFGAVGVGNNGFWWDYGQVQFYIDNNRKMAEDSYEGASMRKFFGVEDDYEGGSTIVASDLGDEESKVKNSVMSNVHTKKIGAVSNSVMVNVTAPCITAKNCVVYNVVSRNPIVLEDGDVLVGMQIPGEDYILMKSNLRNDGKKDWKKVLPSNPLSYEQVYDANLAADPLEIESIYTSLHEKERRKY